VLVAIVKPADGPPDRSPAQHEATRRSPEVGETPRGEESFEMPTAHRSTRTTGSHLARLGVLGLCALAFVACGEDAGKTFDCTEQGVRDAVAAGGGVHTFACAGPTQIDLSAAIEIEKNVRLDGEGNLVLGGDGAHRVFVVAADVESELRNMAMVDAMADVQTSPNLTLSGGAIYNEGHLTLRSCLVQGSVADGGGGVFNDSGTLILIDSEIIENDARNGAGVYNHGGRFEMVGGRLADNIATQTGGGLKNEAFVTGNPVVFEGSAELVEVLVRNNEAVEGAGLHNGATLEVLRSTIIRNGHPSLLDETTQGGGLWNSHTLVVYDSTIDANNAWLGGGLYNRDYARLQGSTFQYNDAPVGGAIYNIDLDGGAIAVVQVSNSTFWANGSDSDASFGGAIYSAEANLDLFFATFANNEANTGSALRTLNGAITLGGTYIEGTCAKTGNAYSASYSVSSTPTCSNVIWFDFALPLVGAPADNGGPTPTSAILSASLVDQIPVADCVDWNGLFTGSDQRGEQRADPPDPACDIGAFEVQP
jgi:hypothetical protein